MTHHLLRVYYHEKAGDEATAGLLRKIGTKGEIARDLALSAVQRLREKEMVSRSAGIQRSVLGVARDCADRA